MTGADVVAEARRHLGTPWVHQGRTPGVALDCIGLVIVVARRLGLVAEDFDINGYPRLPDGTLMPACNLHMTRLDALELGCVLVTVYDRLPHHVGIVGDHASGWSFINAATRHGRVVEQRLVEGRRLRIAGIYRLPGVA